MRTCCRLPSEPLQRAIAHTKEALKLSWAEMGSRLGVTERTLQRVMSEEWVGVYAADRMALRLGLHPSNLWPREWAAVSKGQGTDRTERSSA